MKLEKLLPEKKVWRDYHPQYECDYAWVAQEGKGYNQCRADCLAALEGKVILVSDISWEEIRNVLIDCSGENVEYKASAIVELLTRIVNAELLKEKEARG